MGEEKKRDTVKINIEIGREAHKKVKHESVESGRDMKDILREIIEEGAKTRGGDRDDKGHADGR